MKSLSNLLLAGLTAGTLLVAGCEEPAPPPPAPPAPPMAAPPATWPSQTAELNALTPKLAAEIDSLPGENGSQHRAIAAETLKNLSRFLVLADGPVQTPGFANRIMVIDQAQKTVAKPMVPRGRLVAAENEALHVAVLAAGDIARSYLFDDAELPKLIETAKAQINAIDGIDSVNGSVHDRVMATAMSSLKPVLLQIDQDLDAEFGSATGPAEPAPLPEAVPTPGATGTPTGTPPTTAPVAGDASGDKGAAMMKQLGGATTAPAAPAFDKPVMPLADEPTTQKANNDLGH
jgi:hypothetical protein